MEVSSWEGSDRRERGGRGQTLRVRVAVSLGRIRSTLILTLPRLPRILLLPAVSRGGEERVEQLVAFGGARSSRPAHARRTAA